MYTVICLFNHFTPNEATKRLRLKGLLGVKKYKKNKGVSTLKSEELKRQKISNDNALTF